MKTAIQLGLVLAATAWLSGCSCSGKCSNDTNCAKGQACCNGACLEVASDIHNCGQCGTVCATANAAATCELGLCHLTCASGFADCNASATDGCETKLSNSPTSCGQCGNSCAGPHSAGLCLNGTCAAGACEAGFKDCNGIKSDGCETAVSSSATDCGDCGHACMPSHSSGMCMSGTCRLGTCASGFGDCNGSAGDGCESDLSSDAQHCGDCATQCDPGLRCINRQCSAGGLLLYGGVTDASTNAATDAVTAYDTVSHQFLQVTTSGTSPGARFAHLAVWDATANRMLVWGGYLYAGGTTTDPDANLYALDFTPATPTWSVLTTTGSPPVRAGMPYGFDAAARKLYLFGGADAAGSEYTDTWVLDVATLSWTQLMPSNPPPTRVAGVSAFEGGRLVIGLGLDPATSTGLTDWAAFEPDAGEWSTLAASGDVPLAPGGAGTLGQGAPLTFFGGYDPNLGSGDDRVFVVDESGGGVALHGTSFSPGPGQRVYPGGAGAGGLRYAFGGLDLAGFSTDTDMWSLDLDGGWFLENGGDGNVYFPDGGGPVGDAGTVVMNHPGGLLPSIVTR